MAHTANATRERGETLLIPSAQPLAPTAYPSTQPSSIDSPASGGTSAATTNPPAPAFPEDARKRFGIAVIPGTSNAAGLVDSLGAAWYLDWQAHEEPLSSRGIEFAQMVRLSGASFEPDAAMLATITKANSGALWIVGNEPDVVWQDNATPQQYASAYQRVYAILKTADPSCQAAVGGVAMPSPLRLRYLHQILSSYEAQFGEPMSVDVWNVHAFILREERDSRGVGIPPGFEDASGALYDIDDHDDLEILRQLIVRFRRWMEEHGQRDKPLFVTEYGILMPGDYGFDHQRVRDFMFGSFALFLSEIDTDLGYPADDNRLVQRWVCFSLGYTVHPTGNLVDPSTQEITLLGQDFSSYVSQLP